MVDKRLLIKSYAESLVEEINFLLKNNLDLSEGEIIYSFSGGYYYPQLNNKSNNIDLNLPLLGSLSHIKGLLSE